MTLAGVETSLAAALSLSQQIDRERLHSKAVTKLAARLGIHNPTRRSLAARHMHKERWSTFPGSPPVASGSQLSIAFVIADLVALIATER